MGILKIKIGIKKLNKKKRISIIRDHWSIAFVAEKMDSQFERDIGLLRRAVAVENKAHKQYNLITDLKRKSCHDHNKLRERHGAIRDLQNNIEELNSRPDIDNLIDSYHSRHCGNKFAHSMKYLDEIQDMCEGL